MKRLLPLLLLVSSLCFAGYNSHQVTTFSSVTTATPIQQLGTSSYHQIFWVKSGTVSSCSVQVDTSSDGITYTSGGLITSQTCTTNGNSSLTSGTANYIRINMTVLGGGGTVIITYNGYATSPSGGVSYPLLAPDGNLNAPSYSFINQPTTGCYFDSTLFVIHCVIEGDDSFDVSDGLVTVLGLTNFSSTFLVTSSGGLDSTSQSIIGDGSCQAVGTPANPSIVNCNPGSGIGASAGIFTCDIAASGGTCKVNTENVRQKAVIIVQPNTYIGSLLSVTCNTTPTLTPAIIVASVVNGGSGSGSFTINLPTFTVNPMCYSFHIIGR